MMIYKMDVSECTALGAVLNMQTTSGTSSNLIWSTSTYVIPQEVLEEFIADPMAEDRERVDTLNSGIDEDDIAESGEYETARIEHRKASRLEGFL